MSGEHLQEPGGERGKSRRGARREQALPTICVNNRGNVSTMNGSHGFNFLTGIRPPELLRGHPPGSIAINSRS